MPLSERTQLSLCQLLAEISTGPLDILLQKYGAAEYAMHVPTSAQDAIIRTVIQRLSEGMRWELLGELVRTSDTIRNEISPRYRFDQRWNELQRCLELDGYRVDASNIIAIEPAIEGVVSVADDLQTALLASGLDVNGEIQQQITLSTERYISADPDYTGCLSAARVALEALAKTIAAQCPAYATATHDKTKWGHTVGFLKAQDFIGPKEEDGLTGVYSLISPGSHRVIGLSEQEYTRLGRSLAISITFFLVRRYNGLSGRGGQ